VLFVSQMSFLMSTFKYVCTVFLRLNNLKEGDRQAMGWVLVLLDVVFMVASVVAFVMVVVLLRAIGAGSRQKEQLNKAGVSVKVVPSQQPEQQQQEQQRSTLEQEIVALKWQKNIRKTLVKNTQLGSKGAHTLSRVKSTRTRKVEEIEKNHESHRNMAVQNIKEQQAKRRGSLQLRVQARNQKKNVVQVVNDGAALPENETVLGQVQEQEQEQEQVAPQVVASGGGGGEGGGGVGGGGVGSRSRSDATTINTQERVDTIRLALRKITKTPALFQKWLTHQDKASAGLLSRVHFAKLVRKIVQKMGKEDVKESFMESMWALVKEGGGKDVAGDQVEHGVVKAWVFADR